MPRSLLLLLAMLALGSAVAPARTQDGKLSDGERAACLARGGYVERAGMLGFENCFRRFADAGKACRGKKDCQGRCLLAEETPGATKPGKPARGICARTSNSFGCWTEVENGRTGASICVD